MVLLDLSVYRWPSLPPSLSLPLSFLGILFVETRSSVLQSLPAWPLLPSVVKLFPFADLTRVLQTVAGARASVCPSGGTQHPPVSSVVFSAKVIYCPYPSSSLGNDRTWWQIPVIPSALLGRNAPPAPPKEASTRQLLGPGTCSLSGGTVRGHARVCAFIY